MELGIVDLSWTSTDQYEIWNPPQIDPDSKTAPLKNIWPLYDIFMTLCYYNIWWPALKNCKQIRRVEEETKSAPIVKHCAEYKKTTANGPRTRQDAYDVRDFRRTFFLIGICVFIHKKRVRFIRTRFHVSELYKMCARMLKPSYDRDRFVLKWITSVHASEKK